MQTSIRKAGQDSECQRVQGTRQLRRSKRCRVPNNIYSEGIEELLKEANSKEHQLQTRQASDCRTEVDHSDYGPSDNYGCKDKQQWMKCTLPGTNPRNIEVEVVIGNPTTKRRSARQSRKMSQRENQKNQSSISQEEKENEWQQLDKPRKMFKPDPIKKQSLLEILYTIAKKVADEPLKEFKQPKQEQETCLGTAATNQPQSDQQNPTAPTNQSEILLSE